MISAPSPQTWLTQNAWRKLCSAAGVALAVSVAIGVLTAPRLRAQAAGQAPTIQTQAGSADQPKFETASVKPHDPKIPGGGFKVEPGGRFTGNVRLDNLIANAYGPLNIAETSGWPDWIKSESARYDIEAKAEGNPTYDQVMLMVRSLLEDRFKLVVHREIRQLPVYALVMVKAGKLGPQLHMHTDDTNCIVPTVPLAQTSGINNSSPSTTTPLCGGFLTLGPGRRTGQKITMAQFARLITGLDGRIVFDQTGLSGTYDFTLETAPPLPRGADASAPDPSGLPSIYTALQEQLGLKVESQTGPVSVLIIDHIERPSEN